MTSVLIADDSMFMRKNLSTILKKAGYEVVGEAENGLQAAELYEKTKPDITFLDITMPEVDGINALRTIKKINPKAVAIMCSAMSQQAFISECIELGAADFIVKPFKAETILKKLEKITIR